MDWIFYVFLFLAAGWALRLVFGDANVATGAKVVGAAFLGLSALIWTGVLIAIVVALLMFLL